MTYLDYYLPDDLGAGYSWGGEESQKGDVTLPVKQGQTKVLSLAGAEIVLASPGELPAPMSSIQPSYCFSE